MISFSNDTKNSASFSKQSKNITTFKNDGGSTKSPPAKFGIGRFDRSRFDQADAGDLTEWTNETEN